MNANLSEEIKELNLSYLLLAQRLLRDDKADAMLRLGISDEQVAETLIGLGISQILKIAASSHLMCGFRFDENLIWKLMSNHGAHEATTSMHAAILMADPSRQVLETA